MHATFHNHPGLDVSPEQPPTAEDRRRLRRLPLFAGASDATVQDLLARTPISVVQRHQLAVREGSIPNSVMAVLSGRLALSTQMSGEQPVVIGIVCREELVMPGAAIVASPYPLSARAIEETPHRRGSARRPLGGDRTRPRLCHGPRAPGQRRMAGLLAMLKDYRLRSAPQRFAAYLVRLAKEAGHVEAGTVEIELADDRKTSRQPARHDAENLSRTIAQFRERGVIVSGRQVSIVDLGALAAFAGV